MKINRAFIAFARPPNFSRPGVIAPRRALKQLLLLDAFESSRATREQKVRGRRMKRGETKTHKHIYICIYTQRKRWAQVQSHSTFKLFRLSAHKRLYFHVRI